jgi:hypothetical protein
VKVSPKKRGRQIRNLNLSFASAAGAVRYRALWYSASIILYAWCMYWISRDIFIWHKSLVEISVLNYAGSIVALAFIWLGTRFWKTPRKETRTQVARTRVAVTPVKVKQAAPQKKVAVAAGGACAHYVGYLHEREKSAEIPAECLTCERVIQCLSAEK